MSDRTKKSTVEVRGPWSLATSKTFWEGFAPAELSAAAQPDDELRTVFCAEADWQPVTATVGQRDGTTTVTVRGPGDLDAAAAQVGRFLALDVDATEWPAVGERDPVIADAQRRLPGLRPCGFHSPYEAAAWSVLSQRIRIVQAALLRSQLIRRHGTDGAFPAPAVLRELDMELPGRKTEYLHAVAGAALEGRLDGATLRAMDTAMAMSAVREVNGLGPFAAELVIIRGANAPDVLPTQEKRLTAEVAERYGPDRELAEVAEAWRPFRSWAAVHLRALRERRTREIEG